MNISDANFRVFLAVSGNKLLYSTGIYGIILGVDDEKGAGA